MATDKWVTPRYPADNQFPSSSACVANCVYPAADDFRVLTTSPYVAAGLDQPDPGCSATTLQLTGGTEV